MRRRPPISTRTDPLVPYTTLFRSCPSTSYADGCVIVDIAIDGSDLRVLDLPAAAGMPQDVVWSPDGTQLAFVSRPETDGASRPAHVMVVDRDGAGLHDLGEGSEVERSPTDLKSVV